MITDSFLTAYPDLSEKVYQIIRTDLVMCRLPAGSRLEVVELARNLGVSRSPVTDALNKLCGEGLVTEVPRKGYFVTTLDPRSYAELLDARLMIELAAVEHGLDSVQENELEAMRASLEKMRSCLDEQGAHRDYPRWVEGDREFHAALVSLSDNNHIIQFYERLNTHGHLARMYYSSLVGLIPSSDTMKEHLEIVSAIEKRDISATRQAIIRHIRRIVQSISVDKLTRAPGQVVSVS